ncbi:hypothetical protein K491DRAFT_80821 [Lophiostoma macrostomum CBS 122681]|uniref:Uncharacterized protein n=1 Tax=Lophiostoma macrostomum CBS 122681 TaxID=1314788 RepID=A0A6A6TN58_9PLEO|nr:hypothetical protein K491DRAFT_80821 [Lophiostoma macrostomum CBS 122681]
MLLPPIDVSRLSKQHKEDPVTADATSIVSGTTLRPPKAASTSVKSLFISTMGIPVVRLPAPSSGLILPIYNKDGSLAYQCMRNLRKLGKLGVERQARDAVHRDFILLRVWQRSRSIHPG